MNDSGLTSSDAFTATVLQLFRTNGQMIGWGDRFSSGFGLTSARWQMLGALALASRPLTAPQIATNMGVTRQGVQKQLNALMAEGLVDKRANPYHKRSPLYQLTRDGDALFQRIDQQWQQHARQMRQEFSDQELAITANVLRRIHEFHPHSDKGSVP